jgi:signal transduction histidine kinase
MGGLAYWRFADTLDRDLRLNLQTQMASVAGAVVIEGQPRLDFSRLVNFPESGDSRFQVVKAGQVFFEVGRFPEATSGWLLERRELEGGYVLEGALDTRGRGEALSRLLRTLLLALPLVLALTLGLAYLLFAYLMRPVRQLTQATQALAQQRFPEPLLVPAGNDELSDLAQSFNRMTQAVQGFLERERSFARYTSHELRTPLATLRVQIEALEQGLLPANEIIPTIKASLERLERILAGLLDLTRSPQEAPKPIAVEPALQATLSVLPAPERSRVQISGDLQAHILGYEHLLQQALGNLIHNALKYSQDQVKVQVFSGPQTTIAIQDSGPGVSEAHLSKLGQPFFRLNPKTEGIGLGLALVRHVASLLDGGLEFSNLPEGGLEARLSLPRASGAPYA